MSPWDHNCEVRGWVPETKQLGGWIRAVDAKVCCKYSNKYSKYSNKKKCGANIPTKKRKLKINGCQSNPYELRSFQNWFINPLIDTVSGGQDKYEYLRNKCSGKCKKYWKFESELCCEIKIITGWICWADGTSCSDRWNFLAWIYHCCSGKGINTGRL